MSLAGIWTAKGIDKLAAQTAGGVAVSISRIALGDGGGMVPAVLPSQLTLFNEKWRGNVNSVLIEIETPNAVIVEAVIPYSVGGWHIREWALIDEDGDMIAVGPHAEFYKPLLSEGSGAELLERIQLPIANAGQISLTISSDALATRKFAEATATAKAKEEVARHDGDEEAHGGLLGALEVVADAANAHAKDTNNPHKIPFATTERYGLVQPDGVTTYLTSGGGLLAASPDMPWRVLEDYTAPCLRIGNDGRLYMWKKASGPKIAAVGAKEPGQIGNDDYWYNILPPGKPINYDCVIWVRTDGNDDIASDLVVKDVTASANTPAKAYKTISRAVTDFAANYYLTGQGIITFRLGNTGTYVEPTWVNLPAISALYLEQLPPAGVAKRSQSRISIRGDRDNRSAYIWNVPTNPALSTYGAYVSNFSIEGLSINVVGTAVTYGICFVNGGRLWSTNVTSAGHMVVGNTTFYVVGNCNLTKLPGVPYEAAFHGSTSTCAIVLGDPATDESPSVITLNLQGTSPAVFSAHSFSRILLYPNATIMGTNPGVKYYLSTFSYLETFGRIATIPGAAGGLGTYCIAQ